MRKPSIIALALAMGGFVDGGRAVIEKPDYSYGLNVPLSKQQKKVRPKASKQQRCKRKQANKQKRGKRR